MTPVLQTRFGLANLNDPPGNCWAACIATLLDLPLEAVPDELPHWQAGMPRWQSWRPYERAMHHWLYMQGYMLIQTSADNRFEYCGPSSYFKFLCVMSGPSPRDPSMMHAVVANQDGELVHDPHPHGAGVKTD